MTTYRKANRKKTIPTYISYFLHKQLTAEIKMYNYKIKTSFIRPEMPKARANKIMIVHFYVCRKLDIIRYNT